LSDGEPVTLDIRTQHVGNGDRETRLRPGERGDGSGFLSVPFGGEVALSMRLGG
jgi:hypothetical protein